MAENRSRVFDRRANIEVAALRIIGRDEIEAGWILIVNAGRIHETAGAGRLESFGKLPNFKPADVRRQRYEFVVEQERNYLVLAPFISFEKVLLIFRNLFCALR